VAALVSAAILLWIIGMAGIGAMVGGYSATAKQAPAVKTSGAAPNPHAYKRTRELVTVPPQSIETCKAESGGVINERFMKCRQGYEYVRTVVEPVH
jgi:hypothetical protein